MSQANGFTALFSIVILDIVVCVRAAGSLQSDKLPGIGVSILILSEAVYIGLASAVNRHTRTWKHPWGEAVVLTTYMFIIIGALFHMIIIHLSPFLSSIATPSQAEVLKAEWVLALHLALPTPIFVPTVCFITYRLFGMTNRRRMRRAVADWEANRGNRIPYWKLSATWAGGIINVLTFLGTFYSLGVLSFRTEDPVPYPLLSSTLVLFFSGLLGTPGVKGSKPPSQVVSGSAPPGARVNGDQLIIPVLSWSDDTSVIVISRSFTNSDLILQRYCTNLEYTPYKRSEFKEAIDMLNEVPPDASKTEEFVAHFKTSFRALSDMFSEACAAHYPTVGFAETILKRRHLILDNFEVFDGNSSRMRALALLIINVFLNVMSKRGHSSVKREDYPGLDSVVALIAWGYQTKDSFPLLSAPQEPGDYPPSYLPASYTPSFTTVVDPPSHKASGVVKSLEDSQGKSCFHLRDESGRVYNMSLLDDMVSSLANRQQHEVMFFLLLHRMAQLKDTRLPQMDTLAGGHDVTIRVTEDRVIPIEHSKNLNVVNRLEALDTQDQTRWQEKSLQTGLQSLFVGPQYTYTKRMHAHLFDRVSAESVPVAWNAFWVISQHELSWLLSFMATTGIAAVGALFDT